MRRPLMVPPIVLVFAFLLAGCPVRYSGTKYEYRVPAAGYAVGGGLMVVGAAGMVPGVLGSDAGVLEASLISVGAGLLTLVASFIYHGVMNARYESPDQDDLVIQGDPHAAPVSSSTAVPNKPSPTRWLKCALGASDEAGLCIGKPTQMTQVVAETACPTGFRLPTRAELIRLLGGCRKSVKRNWRGRCRPCADSSKCIHLFGEDQGLYWTSTGVDDSAWYVNFDDGFVGWRYKGLNAGVHCVRVELPPENDP